MDLPKIARRSSFKENCQAKKYTWCACGLSENQPYCDGSHKGTGFSPITVEIEEEKKVSWCGCKYSKNKPFCDGTHRELKEE